MMIRQELTMQGSFHGRDREIQKYIFTGEKSEQVTAPPRVAAARISCGSTERQKGYDPPMMFLHRIVFANQIPGVKRSFSGQKNTCSA